MWTHNLIILSQSRRAEERELHLRMAIRERWGKRELEQQFRHVFFARAVLHPLKVAPLVRQMDGNAIDGVFKDAHLVEFLDLPKAHTEHDLQGGLLSRSLSPALRRRVSNTPARRTGTRSRRRAH